MEDNFQTVNLEALACGTPVITYQTGGSPESLAESCGRVMPYGNYESLKGAILEMKEAKALMSRACMERAKLYGRDDAYNKYISLYKEACIRKAVQ